MICFVSLEHHSWFEDLGNRNSHLTHMMDVKLKVEAMTGQPCLVQRYTDVTHQRLRAWGIASLLISGNAVPFEAYGDGAFSDLFDIIRRASMPILGLCGGHQVIAMAHGAPVATMRRLRPGEPDITDLSAPGCLKEWGFMPVDVVNPDPIFDGLGTAPEFLEVHHCEIKDLPPGFDVLASTEDCAIQVIKQRDKPVYGTQFHPESYTESACDRRNPLVNLVYPDGYPEARPDGRTLLANFFRIAGVSD
ncbi:MAG: gamma-glutamyl-gamma-aminobutyrate hydrolase family protein [Anaerolineae bacterium]